MSYLRLVPVSMCVVLPATYLITYGWSVHNGHSARNSIPRLATTGSLPPESSLFSFLLNVSSALVGFTVYIRYKEVREYVKCRSHALGDSAMTLRRINFWSTCVGLLSCAALDVSANFQSLAAGRLHYAAVQISFLSAAAYVSLQTVVSQWSMPELTSRSVVLLRGFLTIVTVSSALINPVADSVAFTKKAEKSVTVSVSSISEWLTLAGFVLFLLSYYGDFTRLVYNPPVLETKQLPKAVSVQIRKFVSVPSIIEVVSQNDKAHFGKNTL